MGRDSGAGMSDRVREARVTAISLAHAGALAKLLRAHGCTIDADNLEAAVQQAFRIMAAKVGAEVLSDALRWATDEASAAEPQTAPIKAH